MINWEEYKQFGQMMQRASWRFAKTMETMPHHYTLREQWNNDHDFEWAAQFIRDHGYATKFYKRTFQYLNVNEHKYWTMGAPLNETILINKAKIEIQNDYNKIAYKYDVLFRDEESQREDEALFKMLQTFTGDHSTKTVLDVGCGTGLYLNYNNPKKYLGIDPSSAMLELHKHRHPEAATINTILEHFVPSNKQEKYDVIIALYGAASYLNELDFARINQLLAPNGKKFLMFFNENYYPVTYKQTGVQVPHQTWNPETCPGISHKFNNFTVVI